MKKILIPTDFSAPARYALDYAAWFSLSFPAELLAVNVIQPGNGAGQNEKQLKKFTTHYPNQDHEALLSMKGIKSIVKKGRIIDQIIETAIAEEVDLILLGTRAKHNLCEYFMGSISTGLVEKSPVPVLVIPEGSAFEPIEEIAFANKIDLAGQKAFQWLENWSLRLDARINQVFINLFPTDISEEKEANWPLVEADGHVTSVTMVRDKSVSNGLQYYLEAHPAQILAIYLPQRSVLEKWLKGNFTRQMIYNTQIPLLLFR